jgi:hypothetical protein
MELVEGPTLADRIAQGAIPTDEALPETNRRGARSSARAGDHPSGPEASECLTGRAVCPGTLREPIAARPGGPYEWQISIAGGTRAAWARNGRELFYLDASNTLTAVPVETSGSTFSAGKAAKVFDAKYAEPFPPRSFDVSPDGTRFLMMKDGAADSTRRRPA